MAKIPAYTIEQFSDLGDMYCHCEVFNNHFELRPRWSNGVAGIVLTHGYGIFDGHTNKGYFINEEAFKCEADCEEYFNVQIQRCRAKYAGEKNALEIQQKHDMIQQRYLSMQRAMDY